jgi:hypothetical protein
MLDVVLYGFDGRGLLTLQEQPFASLQELATFFASPDSSRWQWAEVEISAEPGHRQIVHYSADALRGMIVDSSRTPSLN